MYIEINGIAVKLSDATLNAYDDHVAYCSAGTDWLIRNDPDCQHESMLIQELLDHLSVDYERAVELSIEDMRESLLLDVDFIQEHASGYFDLIDEAIQSTQIN